MTYRSYTMYLQTKIFQKHIPYFNNSVWFMLCLIISDLMSYTCKQAEEAQNKVAFPQPTCPWPKLLSAFPWPKLIVMQTSLTNWTQTDNTCCDYFWLFSEPLFDDLYNSIILRIKNEDANFKCYTFEFGTNTFLKQG